MKTTELEKQTDNIVRRWLIAIIAVFTIALAVSWIKGGKQEVAKPAPQAEPYPYRKAYLLTARKLHLAEQKAEGVEEINEELEIARQTIEDQEELIHTLMEESNSRSEYRAKIIKEIRRGQMEFKARVNPTLAQMNQITSWFQTKDGLPPKEEFYNYLETQVLSPGQYQEYLEYEGDLEYSNRLKAIADLVRIMDVSNETLDEFYNHEFPTNEEAIASILNEDQLKIWEEYRK